VVADVGTPFLVQQSETGTLCSVAGVIAGGRLLATAASRYRRTWPVASGAASFSETMTPPAGLVERVEALMSGLGWEGIFEVELIHRADGSFAAIDVNPRVYGSLALATVAGAPLPVVWCEWLLGRNGAPVSARPGIRYRREDADLSHALWRLRHGDFAAGVAALAPHRRVTHAYGQLGDPGPLVAQLAGIARRRLVKV
jgi:hypothetical protein